MAASGSMEGKLNLSLCYPTRSFTLLKSDATTTAHQYDEIFYVLVKKEQEQGRETKDSRRRQQHGVKSIILLPLHKI